MGRSCLLRKSGGADTGSALQWERLSMTTSTIREALTFDNLSLVPGTGLRDGDTPRECRRPFAEGHCTGVPVPQRSMGLGLFGRLSTF